MTVNICIIGLGAVGKKRFELFQDNPNIDRVSFYDPTIVTYKDTNSLVSIDQPFQDDSIDVIVICTPNKPKLQLILRALQSQKHVFCEKPPGLSQAETLIIRSCMEKHTDLKLQFGFNHRYLSHYILLKEVINKQIYGSPLWVRGVYGKGYDDSFFEGWRADAEISGGGIFLDQGIHMLDLVLDLVGPLNVHNVLIDSVPDNNTIDNNVFIHLRSQDGIPVSLHSSMLQWRHRFLLEVGTENAIVSIDGIKSSTKSYGNESIRIDSHWKDNSVETQINQYSNPDFYTFQNECNEFIDSIVMNKTISNGSILDAVQLMEIVDNIYSFV